ncbi:MAG: adenylyltransferase/cytidyltransferase family protein [Gammaproteobacteria bacterium]|nr:adenylyltransferase/cytidyltransferase family protein [Gammaproteobacteria bacterium]
MLRYESKIYETLAELEPVIAELARPLVFTNGCFDLVHPGHVDYLEQAATLGKTVVVGVNSDRSIRNLGKGDDRPYNNQQDRMLVVAGLEAVDVVVGFDDATPIALIEAVRPDVLVKGGDWPEDRIVGAQWVREHGGEGAIGTDPLPALDHATRGPDQGLSQPVLPALTWSARRIGHSVSAAAPRWPAPSSPRPACCTWRWPTAPARPPRETGAAGRCAAADPRGRARAGAALPRQRGVHPARHGRRRPCARHAAGAGGRALGAPAASERSGIVNRRTTLLYRAGTDAWIAVSGDETVEEIGIEGRTTLATPEGVRYGMPRHQVSMIYGEPVETDEAGYLYPERGIGFTFRSGTVFQVELFAPREREDG